MKMFSDYIQEDFLTDYKTFGNMFFEMVDSDLERDIYTSVDLLVFLKENPGLDKPFYTTGEKLSQSDIKAGYYAEVMEVIYFVNSAGSSEELRLIYPEVDSFIENLETRKRAWRNELIALKVLGESLDIQFLDYKIDLYEKAIERINNVLREIFED